MSEPEASPQTVSIRSSLSRNLGLLIIGLSLTILATTAFTARRLAASASEQLIVRALDRTRAEMRGFFSPVGRSLQTARGWAETGLLAPDDSEALLDLFLPLLESSPQISSVNLGDAEGRGWMLLRLGDRWRTRRVDPPQLGPAIEYAERDMDRALLRAWREDEPPPEARYDPRTRAWYRVAIEGAARIEPDAELPANVYWTEPYTFFTSGEPGITASVHARTPAGRRLVVAFDVLLEDVSDFTRRLDVSPNGLAAVLSSDRRMVGLPRHANLADPAARAEAFLKHPEEIGVPVLVDAVAARVRAGLPAANDTLSTLLRFESGGEAHWGGARAVSVHPERVFAVVVVIPERDLLGPIRELRLGVLLMSALALGCAMLLAFQLASRYSRPLSRLAANSEHIRQLELDSTQPVRSRISELSELAGAQEGMRSALDSFARYVPTDVVRELLHRGDAARIGGAREELTILFTDVEGFTAISERMSPEEITAHMAEYFGELLPILDAEGTVDKLMGDGIVAFWGAPAPDAEHARHAVEATLTCLERLEERNAEWSARGLPPLPTRFGISCGPAVVGNVGSHSRLQYTAVGDSVNLASRLEGLNRMYGTRAMAAAPVPERAGPGFVWRRVDCVRAKGKSEAVEVFELLGREGSVPAERLARARRYEEALEHYRARRFSDALGVLDSLPAEDLSVMRLREACWPWSDAPPPEDWEPVTTLDRK